LGEIYFLASLAKPTGLGLIVNFIEAAIATAQKDAAVIRSFDDADGHVVGTNHKNWPVHQLHFVVRALTECHAQDNDLNGRSENQEVLDVLHKDAGFWFHQANAYDQMTEAIVVRHIPRLIERPDVDFRIDSQPGTSDFRKEAHGAVAFYVYNR